MSEQEEMACALAGVRATVERVVYGRLFNSAGLSKIMLIKGHRTVTGMGLKDSKLAVEEMLRRLVSPSLSVPLWRVETQTRWWYIRAETKDGAIERALELFKADNPYSSINWSDFRDLSSAVQVVESY
jgi:hypothetical protein